MAHTAFMAVIARKAGCHQLAQSWETGEVNGLNRQLANLRLKSEQRAGRLPIKTELQLAEWQAENKFTFDGFCRVFEYCYDSVRVVSLYN